LHIHFDKYLNLKGWILERKPKVVVECGAGNGDLTRLLATLLDEYPFELHVISDYSVPGLDPRIKWISGLSYEVLSTFPDDSIGLCIIDTDHNYWTLMREFVALFNKIIEGGLIALHDVETFYHDTGMALSYGNDKPYPKSEIERYAPYGSLGDAMIDFLLHHKMKYKLLAYHRENHGGAMIERKTQPYFNIVVPGPGAIFIKKETQNAVLQTR